MCMLFRRKCQGFTLLEVLITVVVLSTGLVLVLQGLHNVLHVWNGGVQRTRAVMTAQEEFARMVYAARRGQRPTSTARVSVAERVEGHSGLYRLRNQDEAVGVDVAAAYEMLLFVAPEREVSP